MTDETQERQSVTLMIRDLNSDNYGYSALEDLISLGATIKTTHYEKYDKHFVTITLPEDFVLGEERIISGFKQIDFYDKNGNKRGIFVIKMDDPKIANICLLTRYGIVTKRYSSADFIFERVYFGDEQEQLFGGGVVSINRRDCSTIYVESQLAKIRENCKKTADELYPDWKSPLAYWDEAPKLKNNNILVRKKEN